MKPNISNSKQSKKAGGYFVISIDYELNWGVLDRKKNEAYRENIINGRNEFLKVIELFQKHSIQATIAVVGLLFNRSKDEMLSNIPNLIPKYTFKNGSPFQGHLDKIGESEKDDPIHYGASILDEIKKHKNLEIATHTYGHYYCLDVGHSKSSFESDIDLSLKLSEQNDINTKSIVLPRNQINQEYLTLCYNKGITSYRGNEKSWIYREGFKRNISPVIRLLRIIDAYVNISGYNTHKISENHPESIINIPSSSFLRPIRHSNALSSWLKIHRIKKAMKHAALNNEIYHLWWHPHNFGKNEKAMFKELNEIINYYLNLSKSHGMESKSMHQISEIVRERKS